MTAYAVFGLLLLGEACGVTYAFVARWFAWREYAAHRDQVNALRAELAKLRDEHTASLIELVHLRILRSRQERNRTSN